MKRYLSFVLVLGLTWVAQAASVAEATRIARQMGEFQELPRNVQLRFQVLANRMDVFQGKEAPKDLLSFFSDTRVMVWNRPVSPPVEQNMRLLEEQMVELAQSRGFNLDLPPVGYAPQSQSRLISAERVTRDGFVNLVLQTERLATDALNTKSSAELLFLRDNLTRLREDLADGTVASDSVRSVLGSRARFLASEDVVGADPRLLQQLTTLGEVLRSTFTPQALRQARGGNLSF